MYLQTRISRTIEDALYKQLLSMGLTPDRDFYQGNPQGYKDKLSEIKVLKGFAVEVFGNSAPSDNYNKFVPRITFNLAGFRAGSVGNDPLPKYQIDSDTGKFNEVIEARTSSNLSVEVCLVSSRSVQDSCLEEVRSLALPNLSYLDVYQEPGEDKPFKILLTYVNVRNAPDFGHGLIDKTYIYDIVDIIEQPDLVNKTTQIAPIAEIIIEDKSTGLNIIKTP